MILHESINNTKTINVFNSLEYRFNDVHLWLYDYSKVLYRGSNIPVTIICPIHGKFYQTPSTHLSGSGCKQCAYDKIGFRCRGTTEQFIKDAKSAHGDKFDYSEVVYKTGQDKVTIICPLHGKFEQKPNDHIRQKYGCGKCGNKISNKHRRLSKGAWINKAIVVHGEIYNYVNTIYSTSHEMVTIKCKLHGEFSQTAGSHLQGCGCPTCGVKKRADLRSITTEEWIKKARARHGDKFTYSSVVYVNATTNVIIYCPLHGKFEQTPDKHLSQKHGCSKCGNEAGGLSLRYTTKEFIKKAKIIHGEQYGYEKVVYTGMYVKVKIRCLQHGYFYQLPSSHVTTACGCPRCGISKQDNDTFYIWEVMDVLWEDLPIFKIGTTSKRLGSRRIKQVSTKANLIPKTHLIIEVKDELATDLERRIHNLLPIIPNMGDIDGKTEFRACSHAKMEAIIEMIKFDEALR